MSTVVLSECRTFSVYKRMYSLHSQSGITFHLHSSSRNPPNNARTRTATTRSPRHCQSHSPLYKRCLIINLCVGFNVIFVSYFITYYSIAVHWQSAWEFSQRRNVIVRFVRHTALCRVENTRTRTHIKPDAFRKLPALLHFQET